MPAKPKRATDIEAELVEFVAGFTGDPLGFVMACFPWGEPNTPLADATGPDEWQRGVLISVRDGLRTVSQAIQYAVASGHGVGKSALVAWLILWAMATHEDTRGVVTANTENQLRTKTWAELSKWFRMLICRHWFTLTATALFSSSPAHAKTWRVDAVPWSENNTEAFAGLHNAGKRVIVIFDEASAIPDIIWETTEGALTDADTEIMWFCFGNPTRNAGRFRECFGRYRHRWTTQQIDSRTVAITNKDQIQQWVDDYGEDSDFVRVRVRGVFPRAGSMQFISGDVALEAMKRDVRALPTDAVVLGVDIARHGDDQSVIAIRQGADARSRPWVKARITDLMELAAKVAEVWRETDAAMVFVDAGGMGWGVYDRLKQLGVPVTAVDFGDPPKKVWKLDSPIKLKNRRAEIWAAMKEWLPRGGIPDDRELEADLTGIEYGYTPQEELILERKQHMKARGLASPDSADALALTFAQPIFKKPKPQAEAAPVVSSAWSV